MSQTQNPFKEGKRGDDGLPPWVLQQLAECLSDDSSRGIREIEASRPVSQNTASAIGRICNALYGAEAPHIAIVTGFPVMVEDGSVKYENDGPIGMGHLIQTFSVLGWRTTLVSDQSAFEMLQVIAERDPSYKGMVTIDTVSSDNHEQECQKLKARLAAAGVTHIFFIERPGLSYDGRMRNMKADDITPLAVSLDGLADQDVPWKTFSFADGGNEIGMGQVPRAQIAQYVKHGDQIACATAVDELMLSTVSNWGSYAIVAALAMAKPTFGAKLLSKFSAEEENKMMGALIAMGVVDGVRRIPAMSVDGIPAERHLEKISQFAEIAKTYLQKAGGAHMMDQVWSA